MKIQYKYTLGGIAFGLAFPIISVCFLLYYKEYQSINLPLMHQEHPLLYIIDLAPFILGIMAFIIGQKQRLNIEQELRNTQSLRDKNIFLEEEIKKRDKLEKKLKNAIKEAIHARETEQRFLANMSHEIRTPLNSIIGFSKILLSGSELDIKSKEYLKTIRFASNHLLSVVNDILDISKINAGEISFETRTIELKSTIRETINTLKGTSQNKTLDIDYRLFTDESVFIKTDLVRLNQILFNLLNNAIKFTKKGSVSLIIDDVSNSSTNDNLKLRFEVRDTGIGIKKDKLDLIFNNFTQAETSTTREYGGTGLGLSITKKIVELQKGAIGVNSEFGVGSTFWFEIEYEKGSPNDIKAKTISDFKDYKPKKDIHVLIAEDNEMNQFLIKTIFENWGDYFVISFANNGLEAFEMVQLEYYDLVLMDLQMPVKDGFESTQMIRALPTSTKNIPIIALTADVLEDEKNKALDMGMSMFLTKPIQPEILFPAILDCLQLEYHSR